MPGHGDGGLWGGGSTQGPAGLSWQAWRCLLRQCWLPRGPRGCLGEESRYRWR